MSEEGPAGKDKGIKPACGRAGKKAKVI